MFESLFLLAKEADGHSNLSQVTGERPLWPMSGRPRWRT